MRKISIMMLVTLTVSFIIAQKTPQIDSVVVRSTKDSLRAIDSLKSTPPTLTDSISNDLLTKVKLYTDSTENFRAAIKRRIDTLRKQQDTIIKQTKLIANIKN